MRRPWAMLLQVGVAVAVLLLGVDSAGVRGSRGHLVALDIDQGSDPSLASAVLLTAPAGPEAEHTATAAPAPPADPRPADAVDEDPPVRTTDTWVPATQARVEPEVAGIAVLAPTAVPAPTVAPAPTAVPAPTEVSEVSAPAPPPTPTVDPLVTQRQDALALIGYAWTAALPGWRIDFVSEQSGVRGLTFTTERRIEIYVRSGDTAWELARVVAHELGHAVDLTHNDAAERLAWLEQRGIADTPWWPGSGAADFDSGAGDFAECFATWQVGSASLALGGPCTAADLDMVASLS